MADLALAPKRNIFDIDAELDQIAEAFDTLEEGGVEDDVKAAVLAYFGGLLDERDQKLDRYAGLIAAKAAAASIRKAEADAYQAEADRLKGLAKADDNAAKSAKRYLQILFESKGWTKIETKFHKFWVQANGGKPPVRLAPGLDPNAVDARFQKVTVEIDEGAVREALLAGEVLEFAELAPVGSHLRVK